MSRGTSRIALLSLMVCVCTASASEAQFIRDLDMRTIVDVGPVDVAPCTCVEKPFTFSQFRVDERWGFGPAAPLWPGPRPESERLALAVEAADLALHLDESVIRAFNGNPFEAFRIAMVSAAGIGVHVDEANTLAWFVLAAASGDDPTVPTLVAYRVLQGIGTPADSVTAAQWFRLGAARGDPKAMIALGLLYATGKGVGVNLSTAVQWWIRAGSPMAQRLLGDAYACGLGVEQDLARAATIYRAAATSSVRPFGLQSEGSVLQLARMHRDACGVGRDDDEAFRLLEIESNNGNPEAQVELAELALARDASDRNQAMSAYTFASVAALRLPRGPLRERAEKIRAAIATRMTADARRTADNVVAAMMAVGRPDPARTAQAPGKP